MFPKLVRGLAFVFGLYFLLCVFHINYKQLRNNPIAETHLPLNQTSLDSKGLNSVTISSVAKKSSSNSIRNLMRYRINTGLLRSLNNETLLSEMKGDIMEQIRISLNKELQIPSNIWAQNNSENPKKTLIVTTWRSGSTFFGELLNQFPGSYYFYEPLVEKNIKNTTKSSEIEIMKHLFDCNYEDIKHSQETKWIVKHNSRLMPSCKNTLAFEANDPCLDSNFLSQVCSLFPIRLMKTVRLETQKVEDLMEQLPDLKVISLIRDPRGILASRGRMPWCVKPACSNVELVCARYNRDVDSSFYLKSKFPQRFTIVRYEDLSLNLYGTVQSVLEFLKFPLTEKVIHVSLDHYS